MLRWCSYCQRFLGEVPPYAELAVTHGICESCEEHGPDLLEADPERIQFLRELQRRLGMAGKAGDPGAAETVIREAAAANVRGIDILLGIVAPLLYQIGEDWRTSTITVAEEHRFTAFCEAIYERIAAGYKMTVVAPGSRPTVVSGPGNGVLLMNAAHNVHTLGIRVLALWLHCEGIPVRVIHPTPALEEMDSLVAALRPGKVLISMALAEQRPGVVAMIDRLAMLPEEIRPEVVVGGYAVKLDLVESIPRARMVADIASV
jgi:methanogenic corrinoid protein MtbC1